MIQIPLEFRLEQNYPNPFSTKGGFASSENFGTMIQWQSPLAGWHNIKLYDILGREIQTIVEGYFETGAHSTFYIPNSSLPSGLHFYKLTAGPYYEVKKMILSK